MVMGVHPDTHFLLSHNHRLGVDHQRNVFRLHRFGAGQNPPRGACFEVHHDEGGAAAKGGIGDIDRLMIEVRPD